MNKDKIQQAFESFNGMRVLVIGDVMIDSYLWGNVNRISPEAPVPILEGLKKEVRLGGAANVAKNIKALGAYPVLCSVVGDDDSGKALVDLLEEREIGADAVLKVRGRPTTVKTRVISANQHLLRIDEETTEALSATHEKQLIELACKVISNQQVDAIIFEDYDKGAISPGLISAVVELANAKGIPSLVDPKKKNYWEYHNVTLFKPNFKEFVEGMKLELEKGDFDGLKQAALKFQQQTGAQHLLVTLAERGVYVCDTGVQKNVPIAQKLDVLDVSGAGDTVISVTALCLAAGLSLNDIGFIVNFAGGQVCEKPGVVSVDKSLLLETVLKKN